MQLYSIGVISCAPQAITVFCDCNIFNPIVTDTPEALLKHQDSDAIRLVVIDQPSNPCWDDDFYRSIRSQFLPLGTPIVFLVNKDISLQNKIDTIEAGFSDIIQIKDSIDSISTRFMSEIYHQIADSQLKENIQQAQNAAFSAMKESSNLGQNIQFLLKVQDCDDLSQMGQVFFQTIDEYGLNCSLQMRSEFGTHNMTNNGMQKALESELLDKLKDHGRYYDFGQRTVINYGSISLLIRNMPEDENLYGLVKDNTFTLLQGLDAKVHSLDEHIQLEQEKQALEQLSSNIALVMKDIEGDFQSIMLKIVDVVENMAENIESNIPLLLLNEDQEKFISNTVQSCVQNSNQVFSEGLHIDKHFEGLISNIEVTLTNAAKLNQTRTKQREYQQQQAVAGADIELF